MKYIYIIIVSIFSIPFSVYADSEEDSCFKLLNEGVKNDTRFKDSRILKKGDLKEVLYNEENGSVYDFSNYENFLTQRVQNGTKQGAPYYFFSARRNNIGTIISGGDYLVSQIAGFGRSSNFDFPLNEKGKSLGDKYTFPGGFFKEYVLYTHHLDDTGDLLSCGIVKVTPLGGKSFSDIDESGYMTNILTGKQQQAALGGSKCNSSFEGQYLTDQDKKFYRMKTNVCVLDYDQEDYLKLELISVAYDNNSSRLNEYITHPFQVEAMLNTGARAQGLKGVQDYFRNLLDTKTCFSIVHGSKVNLPSTCNNKFSGLISSIEFFKNIITFVFPSAEAKIDTTQLNTVGNQENDTGMMVQSNIPYRLYKKLESIPDQNFREFMYMVILPNFDDILENRKKSGLVLSPYEETFMACGMQYQERIDVVIDFLEKLNIDEFSLDKISYINKKFGDCVIPYPDKDNINTVVEGAFESNKLLAQQLSGQYKGEGEIESDYFKNISNISDLYSKKLQDLETQFNSGTISSEEFDAQKKLILEEQNQKLGDLEQDYNTQIQIRNEALGQQQKKNTEGLFTNFYVILSSIVFILLGIAMVLFFIWKKNKKK